MSLSKSVHAYLELLTTGRSLEAMRRYYSEGVSLLENRSLARVGKDACLKAEAEQLARLPEPPRFLLRGLAVNPAEGSAYVELTLRVIAPDGHVMRLDEVIAQTWDDGKIVSERHYYEGFVDEGPLSDETSTPLPPPA